MRKQTRTIANLGTIDFTKIELMDSFEMYIDITNLSEDLKKKVNNAVEEGKHIYEMEENGYMKIHNQKWCEAGVMTIPQLHISFNRDGKIEYELNIFFQDLEDDDLFTSVDIDIDLSSHMSELKKIILHVLVDKFM